MIKFMGKNYEIYLCVLLIFFCLNVSGCSLVNQPEKLRPEINELKKGETAFFKKKYTIAGNIFNSILNKSPDPKFRNIALYNLACTKLATSKTKTDSIDAMKLLDKWHPPKPGKPHFENPQLFIQGFRKSENLQKNEKVSTIIQDQNDKIIKLERLIKTLKYQITELENIDHEIQEKRQAN